MAATNTTDCVVAADPAGDQWSATAGFGSIDGRSIDLTSVRMSARGTDLDVRLQVPSIGAPDASGVTNRLYTAQWRVAADPVARYRGVVALKTNDEWSFFVGDPRIFPRTWKSVSGSVDVVEGSISFTVGLTQSELASGALYDVEGEAYEFVGAWHPQVDEAVVAITNDITSAVRGEGGTFAFTADCS